ncbi:CEL6 protein [Schizopora paradoxa]|uniref:CEL6 protein n=1 Tax=Schizopora paradoxa TaxID=27342 RepID=A0A0H2R8X9_9AGAM|nr:CEL6 protein [Schizopora paradoxa]
MTALGVALYASIVSAVVVTFEPYIWSNVEIGGGGGFVPNIIFNPSSPGLAYARTDVGGVYRLDPYEDSWTQLLDFVNDTNANYMGAGAYALATDPVQPENLYIAVGLYTNSWDPKNGTILKSHDRGESFSFIPLPFKVGGNMPGRGLGERLAVDPNNNNILYFGTRSGNGLWKSIDAGDHWSQVSNFPSVGTYAPDPTDTSGYNSDITGIAWVTFDLNTDATDGSSRIFVGVANMGSDNVFMSTDSGSTWTAIPGQNNTFIPHHGALSPAENALYIPYANGVGPWDGTLGYVMKYFIANGSWVDITPAQGILDNYYGYSGISVDLQRPGTVMVAPSNEYYPDANIFRSTDGGASWTQIYSYGYPPPNYVGTKTPYYKFDVSAAPWIDTFLTGNSEQVGWGIQGLAIDPHDSNHWLYGTGLTIYGGHDLLNWDASPRKNITLASLATGVEETAVQGLTAPISGPKIVSVVGDVGGFVHTDLSAPPLPFTNPIWPGTASDVDHAGANPSNIVRLSGIASSSTVSVATSTNGGSTWSPYAGAPSPSENIYGGKIAMNGSPFSTVHGLQSNAIIASDKLNKTIFYAASGSQFFVSTDGGSTFEQKAVLGDSTTPVRIAVSPFKTGELFVSSDKGIWHSSDPGSSLSSMPGPTAAWSISVGKASSLTSPVSLFAAAQMNGVNSMYRTDDLGETWARLSTTQDGLGAVDFMVLAADPNVYSQVFAGIGGRGIFYGHS